LTSPRGYIAAKWIAALTLLSKEAVMALESPGTRDLFIVDDDMMMRDALSVVFTLAGYRVIVFVDAGTFLAAAHSRAGLRVA
jgi:hypothetical protein